MEMKDSGKRQSFGDGAAVRDSSEGKPQMHLLSPWVWMHLPYGRHIGAFLLDRNGSHLHDAFTEMLQKYGWDRLCVWLELGAAKYSEFNWAKGMPVSRCIDSLGRHLVKLAAGEEDEDHAAAAMCNIMFIIHYLSAVNLEMLDESFEDTFDFDILKREPEDVEPDRDREACRSADLEPINEFISEMADMSSSYFSKLSDRQLAAQHKADEAMLRPPVLHPREPRSTQDEKRQAKFFGLHPELKKVLDNRKYNSTKTPPPVHMPGGRHTTLPAGVVPE
jgi:hypothetical protein